MPPNNAAGGNNIYGTPRTDNVNLNKLEGVGKFDGIPQMFFRQTFIKKFKAKLADKTQDGYTMVAVADGTDMCGRVWTMNNNALPVVPQGGPVAGTVYQHVPTAAQINQHGLRNSRLLQIILMHLDEDTPLHAELTLYGQEGHAALVRMTTYGHIATSDDMNSRLTHIWSTMTIDNLQLLINGKTLTQWAMIVLKVREYFDVPKTNAEAKVVFLRGLPVQMLAMKSAEITVPNAGCLFPQHYPQLLAPGVPHPSAGAQHPSAGQPDIIALANSWSFAFTEMLQTKAIEVNNKRTPVDTSLEAIINEVYNGITTSINVGNFQGRGRRGGPPGKSKTPQLQNRSKPRPMTDAELKRVCIKCGGIGHNAAWKLNDGKISYCKTYNTIPDDKAALMRYPWLNGASLVDIRKSVYKQSGKDMSKMAFVDVSGVNITIAAATAEEAQPASQPAASDATTEFLGLTIVDGDDDDDETDTQHSGEEPDV